MNSQDQIWYACYGSSILEERFLCYIQGGQPNGTRTIYDGCRDKTHAFVEVLLQRNTKLT